MSLNAYDVPFNDLEEKLVSLVREVLELRHGTAGDPDGPLSDPDLLHGSAGIMRELRRVRMRSDRVEEVLAIVTQARGRARRARDEAAFVADLAYDEATMQGKVARSSDSFDTREERNAQATLASLNQKREAHQAKRLVSVAEEAFEVVSQIHRQLDERRKDYRASLHALQFESVLER